MLNSEEVSHKTALVVFNLIQNKPKDRKSKLRLIIVLVLKSFNTIKHACNLTQYLFNTLIRSY